MPSLTVASGGFAGRIRRSTVFVGAHACSDHGSGPAYAKLNVDREFCERLLHLQQLCRDENLSEVRVYDAPECWGPQNDIDDLRLVNAELVVGRDVFWFADYVKHAEYAIETKALRISHFIADVCRGSDPLYLEIDAAEVLS